MAQLQSDLTAAQEMVGKAQSRVDQLHKDILLTQAEVEVARRDALATKTVGAAAKATHLLARARTVFEEGFASRCSIFLVNGLRNSPAGRPGFSATTNFAKPGSTNTLLFLSSFSPTLVSASRTDLTWALETVSPIDS